MKQAHGALRFARVPSGQCSALGRWGLSAGAQDCDTDRMAALHRAVGALHLIAVSFFSALGSACLQDV